jgi:hypothetical protein
MSMSQGEASRLVQCSECSAFYPARTTADDDLVPSGGIPGGRCNCGSDEFEEVTLASFD